VRIFKTKTLAKFTRQHGISDDGLVEAVERAVRGLIDADLGGQIIKQRVARPGQSKRGGFRMIIGIRSDRAIFLFAFAKNERENIDKAELMTLREIVASFLKRSRGDNRTSLERWNFNRGATWQRRQERQRQGPAG
jgi:hypothetical protein